MDNKVLKTVAIIAVGIGAIALIAKCADSDSGGGSGLGGGQNNQVNYQTITTVEELKALNNSSAIVKLGADIDLSNEEVWTPIEGFTGTLNGDGHSIIGLTIDAVNIDNVGFFGTLEGMVEDLSFVDAEISARGEKSNLGILAGINKGTIKDVTVGGTITAKYQSNVGGIVGKSENGLIEGCDNRATVTGGNCTGGVVGYVQVNDNDKLNKNENNGYVTGKENVGGIAGYLTSPARNDYQDEKIFTLSNNENNGEVEGTSCVGGVFGYVLGADNTYSGYNDSFFQISLLNNTAKVTGDGNYTGGLVGYATRLSILSLCENSANITGENYVGGFVGYALECNIRASEFENTSTITGKGYVGGFAGYAGVIENAINNGVISSTAVIIEDSVSRSYVGGIAGYCSGLIDCINNSDITVTTANNCYVGGLAGVICVRESEKVNGNENNGAVTGKENVGGIAGYLTSPARNDYQDEKIFTLSNNENNGEVEGTSCVGGVFGYVLGADNTYSRYNDSFFQISLLNNTAKVTGDNDYVGGLVGYATRLSILSLCENSADITGGNYVGGFVGYAPECNIRASEFENENTIAGKTYVGGFAGYAGVIENAINNGIINCTLIYNGNSAHNVYIGGIAGYCSGLIDSTNNSDITVTTKYGGDVGGLAGRVCVSESGKVNGNENNGAITSASSSVGGIAGILISASNFSNDKTITVSENVNNGNIQGASYVGGIFGNVEGTTGNYSYDECYFEVTYCTNRGTVSGSMFAGGIIGGHKRLKIDSNLMDTNTTTVGNKLGQDYEL